MAKFTRAHARSLAMYAAGFPSNPTRDLVARTLAAHLLRADRTGTFDTVAFVKLCGATHEAIAHEQRMADAHATAAYNANPRSYP